MDANKREWKKQINCRGGFGSPQQTFGIERRAKKFIAAAALVRSSFAFIRVHSRLNLNQCRAPLSGQVSPSAA
jgi:hypothetical protein